MEHGESREKYETPEEAMEACLDSLENIEEVETSQIEAIIELAEARIFEIFEPQIKDKYRRVIQALRTRSAKNLQTVAPVGSGIILPREHVITDQDRNEIVMTVTTHEISNLSDMTLLSEVDRNSVDRQNSRGYLILIGERDHSCWINLKLFKLKFKDGSEKTFLYIADRYVALPRRGKKIGEALLGLADETALDNRSSLIFAKLIPENPAELPYLVKGHEKAGYRISREQDLVVAKKDFQ